jgi:FimV-like protein
VANASATAAGAAPAASQPRAQVSSLQQLLALKNRVLMELQKHGIGGKPAASPQATNGAAATGGQAAVPSPSGASGAASAAAAAATNRAPAPAATQDVAASSSMPKEGYVGVAALIGAALAAVVAGLAMRRRKQAAASDDAARAATQPEAPVAPPQGGQAAANAYGEMARNDDAPAQDVATARIGQPEAPQEHRNDGIEAQEQHRYDEPDLHAPAADITDEAHGTTPSHDSGPELHESPEAAHPVAAAAAHEVPGLTLDLPPVVAASTQPQPVEEAKELAVEDERAELLPSPEALPQDLEHEAQSHVDPAPLSAEATEAPLSVEADHPSASAEAKLPPSTPVEQPARATAAATPSHEDTAEASATPDAPHPEPTESDAAPTAPLPFPRAALDALNSLELTLPPRAEAASPITPPASLSTQPVVEPEITARQAVPQHEPQAPRVGDEIEAGTAGAGAIAGMGAANYGPLKLDFDLELPSDAATEPLPTFTPEELARIARNKLDLAAEYIQLGDVAGARTLINEVIESNDAATRNDARALLSTLAPLS